VRRKKKCAVKEKRVGVLFGGSAKSQEISHVARFLAPFEMTGTIGRSHLVGRFTSGHDVFLLASVRKFSCRRNDGYYRAVAFGREIYFEA